MLSNMSLKYRIAIIIFILEGVMMGIVLWKSLGQSYEASEKQQLQNEEIIMALVSGIALPALITEEYAELQRYISSLLSNATVFNVYVADDSLRVVASSDNNTIGKSLTELAANDGYQWRETEISTHGDNFGYLAIEFSRKELIQAFSDARNFGISLAFIGMVIIAVIGISVGFLLTRRLERISSIATELAKGEFSSRTNIHGKDELGRLGTSFDLMIDSLQENQERLSQTLNELRNREQNLEITLKSIGDAVIVTDKQGVVTLLNSAAESITAWSNQEAVGKHIEEIYAVHDLQTKQAIEHPVGQVISCGKTLRRENNKMLLARDGREYFIIDSAAPISGANGEIIGSVLVFNDISEQYKLRLELEEGRRNLQAIMDHSPSVVYVKNLNGEFSFINQKFLSIFDLSREQVIGKTDFDILPAQVAQKLQENDAKVLASGAHLEIEEEIPQADGNRLYASEKFLLRNKEGKVFALCGISTDVTERKEQENQLKRAQKMDALGKLTGGVAHDFNNLLNIIMGFAQLIELYADGADERILESANHIRQAGERGAKLTKRMLAFSRQNSSKNQAVDLNKVISENHHMLQKVITVRIELALDLSADIWLCDIDPADFEDALINLSLNAMHAMDDKGKLTISTSNTRAIDEKAIALANAGDEYVKLSVRDTGCGMDAETLERVFDPFFTTKGTKGTGLGLSQVYGFVNRCKGQIRVHSTLGQGSQFDLYFPRYKASSDKPVAVENSRQDPVGGSESILVVDDEPELVELAKLMLEQYGYHVFGCTSAQEAISVLQKQNVDLVISDIVMPGMDGYELADVIMESFPKTKIQLVSGFDDRDNPNPKYSSIQENILYKPYSRQILLDRVQSIFK